MSEPQREDATEPGHLTLPHGVCRGHAVLQEESTAGRAACKICRTLRFSPGAPPSRGGRISTALTLRWFRRGAHSWGGLLLALASS